MARRNRQYSLQSAIKLTLTVMRTLQSAYPHAMEDPLIRAMTYVYAQNASHKHGTIFGLYSQAWYDFIQWVRDTQIYAADFAVKGKGLWRAALLKGLKYAYKEKLTGDAVADRLEADGFPPVIAQAVGDYISRRLSPATEVTVG